MNWFTTDWAIVFKILLTVIGVLSAVIVCIRINGLRTLSKMSSFDFSVTVAVGSIVAATVASSEPALLEGVVALIGLIAFQRLVAEMRVRFGASEYVDNEPLLLMFEGKHQHDAMVKSRVTEADIASKLREVNVHRLSDVYAVVLESTGDLTVLHGEGGHKPDESLMHGVRRYPSVA